MSNGENQYAHNPWYQLARDFLNLLTLLFVAYSTNMSVKNNTKIEQVEERQSEVRAKQDDAAVRAERVKEKLEKRFSEDTKAQGVQLFATWKYLEDVASNSGSARDRAKALEARQAYEEHVQRQSEPRD